MRDMTETQYQDALKHHNFTPEGFMGYYKLGTTGVRASVWNAGPTRRRKLGYLLQCFGAEQKRIERATK